MPNRFAGGAILGEVEPSDQGIECVGHLAQLSGRCHDMLDLCGHLLGRGSDFLC